MEREQLSWQERGQLWLRLIIRLVLAAAAVVLVAKLGPPLLSLFAPFVAALIVAALLNPAVRWLQRSWSRKLLSLLLVVVIFGVIGGCLGILTYAAANELVSLAQNWSGMLTQVEGFFDQMEALFARAMDLLPLSVVGTVEDTVNALIQRLQAVDPTALLSAAKAATDWAMRVPEFLLYLLGILGLVLTLGGDALLGGGRELWYSDTAPGVALTAAALCALFRYVLGISEERSRRRAVHALGSYVFGAYLIHQLWMLLFRWLGLTVTALEPVFFVPLLALVLLALSLPMAWLLRLIPGAGKWLT